MTLHGFVHLGLRSSVCLADLAMIDNLFACITYHSRCFHASLVVNRSV